MTWQTVTGRIIFLMGLAWSGGCASPPSVVPLLNVVDRALVSEQAAIETEGQRRADHFEQSRRALTDAFEADLSMQGELDRQWVSDHARVYAAAREALLREQLKQQQNLATRKENLALARNAQARAIHLIQRQDALFRDVPDLRRWVRDMLTKETNDER